MSKVAKWGPVMPEVAGERRTWLADVPFAKWLGFGLLLALLVSLSWYRLVVRAESALPVVAPMVAPLIIVGCLLRASAILRPHRALRRRLKAVSKRSCYPVKMTLWRNEVAYGQDDGTVSFENGALVFEGISTRFRLEPSDVRPRVEQYARGVPESDRDWKYGNHDGENAWSFDLAADETVRVYFFPLRVRGFSSVYGPLYQWLVRPPIASGETVLPPLDPMPGYRAPVLRSKR